MAQFLILAAIDVAGLFAIWFLLRSRVGRYLELENLLSGVREEARALIIELNETADRNVSLVEDRVKALRELLDEADKRMGLVRRELGARAAEREVYARLNKRRPIVPAEDAVAAPLEAPAAPEPAAEARAEILPEVRISEERIEAVKTARERVVELHRKGFSAQVIAAKVGATVAEVELMIEMEEMRPAAR